jgi:Fe2+ or Zn2+ uptake regulation protein
LLCDGCGRVTEAHAPDSYRKIGEAAQAARFFPRAIIVEVSGTCAECRDSAAATPC